MTPFTRALAGILPGGALAGPGPSAHVWLGTIADKSDQRATYVSLHAAS